MPCSKGLAENDSVYLSINEKPIIVLSTTLRGIADVVESNEMYSDLDSFVVRDALSKCGVLVESK